MIRVALVVMMRPRLWKPAVKAVGRVGLRPSRRWWNWRLETAYGRVQRPRPEDVVSWLEWCDAFEGER